MLAVLIINYRTAYATKLCIDALMPQLAESAAVYLLDNNSGSVDVELLETVTSQQRQINLILATENFGFAGGMNRLLDTALANPSHSHFVLLNSDAQIAPNFVANLTRVVSPGGNVDMVAGTMLDATDNSVDSLGITLFRSTLASNRKRENEQLLGPSGGCALLTRNLLETVYAAHGEYFDASFFCYAEDTDLVVRALSLGFRASYAADAVAHHVGSLSSGGRDNDFVLYHGIRNSIWWLVKNAPLGWFLRSLPWFIALHAAIWIRHLRRGKGRVLWRLYRDAIKGIPAMRKKRAVIKRSRRVPASEFSNWVEPHFYERGYLKRAWRELFKPAPKL